MKEMIIFTVTGLIIMVLGILFLKREKRLFQDPVETTATVTTYNEYYDQTPAGKQLMYTMVVEYRLQDGTLIQAPEQSGSNRKKYREGKVLQILYSREKTDMFIVKGDHSRKIILVGMIVVGALMIVGGFYMIFFL